MGTGDASRAVGCGRRQARRRSTVVVDDLARAVVDLVVNGADVRTIDTPAGVRVTVADAVGHLLDLVERPTP